MTGATKPPVDTLPRGSPVLRKRTGVPLPPPRARPPFTVAQIREAIPAHCFQRSVLRSFGHLAVNLFLVAVLGYLGVQLYNSPLPVVVKAVAWVAYWYAQGLTMTGVWVLAHECGHQAFTPYRWLNDAVGLVLHSALLVPYHSWRISHANHHKNTCSIENDEVFVPHLRSAYTAAELVEESPIVSVLQVIKMLLFGWPMYLIANVSGPAKYKNKRNSHFNPSSALYQPSQGSDIVVSDYGIVAALSLFAYCVYTFGWTAVACLYFVPYLIVNLYLVLITYLQHTAPYVPHYRNDEFDWLRGALSTVDRSFGWLSDHMLHHITDTHVVHHLFHTMPFYHAVEATEAVKDLLGPYYLKDDTPILKSLYTSWRTCRLVEDTGAYLHFKAQ